MNCETNDCRREKRGCKGCYYDELKEDLIEHEKTSFEFQEENIKLRKELETYKKIAEKLADKSDIKVHSKICINVSDDICDKRSCNQCIIDWARKEVEKDGTC